MTRDFDRIAPRSFGIALTSWVAMIGAAGCAPSAGSTLDEALSRISAEDMRTHVSVLAHDSMRGRDTDDIGYEKARDYVSGEFARLGLQPIEGDSYLQPLDLLELVSDAGSRLSWGTTSLGFPEVLTTPDWLGSRPVLSGEAVFLGHELVAGELSPGRAQALRGNVAFVLAGTPEGRADDPEVAMRERAEVELALRAGAIAVVVLNPDTNERAWAIRANPRRPTRVLADGTTPSPRPTAQVGPVGSRQLIQQFQAGTVGTVTIEPKHETRRVTSWNVVGLWPGADATLSEEAIVFTAHLDHVGVGPPGFDGDSVYNGTHDNALGIAKVLAVADALAGAELPRSVLFLMTGAEESGLLGAWHYVNDPVVPLERTVAAINHDGGLASGELTDDVFAWGPEFSSIEGDVAWAASETDMVLARATTAPFAPSAGLLYRSDHYPFLISGVPVVYLMPGFSVGGDPERGRQAWEEYLGTIHHRQGDDFDPTAAYTLPVALTAMSVRLAWRLAEAEGMPRTHGDAPIARRRGAPTGWFFGAHWDSP